MSKDHERTAHIGATLIEGAMIRPQVGRPGQQARPKPKPPSSEDQERGDE
jgi:hypothetical protein